jgi:hypothetical protein
VEKDVQHFLHFPNDFGLLDETPTEAKDKKKQEKLAMKHTFAALRNMGPIYPVTYSFQDGYKPVVAESVTPEIDESIPWEEPEHVYQESLKYMRRVGRYFSKTLENRFLVQNLMHGDDDYEKLADLDNFGEGCGKCDEKSKWFGATPTD